MSKLFSGKLPCTFWKILILARVYSSESPRNCGSSLHLFATLGNLTLRHSDSNLQLQAALAIRLKPC